MSKHPLHSELVHTLCHRIVISQVVGLHAHVLDGIRLIERLRRSSSRHFAIETGCSFIGNVLVLCQQNKLQRLQHCFYIILESHNLLVRARLGVSWRFTLQGSEEFGLRVVSRSWSTLGSEYFALFRSDSGVAAS